MRRVISKIFAGLVLLTVLLPSGVSANPQASHQLLAQSRKQQAQQAQQAAQNNAKKAAQLQQQAKKRAAEKGR